jgi:hypothetical protein
MVAKKKRGTKEWRNARVEEEKRETKDLAIQSMNKPEAHGRKIK